MKNITFSADERLIKQAREKARQQNTTLNAAFREWLAQFARQKEVGKNYRELMKKFEYAKPGRKFSRDEMNER